MRVLEGRDAIVGHGRSLFDHAETELFLMITADGLLDEACVSRLVAALDRGVDVYLGSQTPAVRTLVRERLPGVTVWEPKLDWLDLPPERERVGRLVMVDREAVLVGTLVEQLAPDRYAERAVVADGGDDALVVLFREMLGSRLDGQSDELGAQMPL